MNNVLLIENDVDAASTLSQFLTANNYKVTAVDDGTVALRHLKQNEVNLILMAAEINQGKGYAICNKLKKDPTCANIPLVIFSSSANAESTFSKHRALPTKADLYMKKPMKLDTLLAQMQALLTSGKALTITSGPANRPVARHEVTITATTSSISAPTSVYKIPDEILNRAQATTITPAPKLDNSEATQIVNTQFLAKMFSDDEQTVSAVHPAKAASDSSAINEENQRLKIRIARLEQDLSSLKEKHEQDSAQISSQAEQYNLLKEKQAQLATKCKAIIAERDELKANLEANQTSSTNDSATISTLKQQLAQLKANSANELLERQNLENRIEDLSAMLKRERGLSQTSQGEFQAQLAASQKQVETLNEEIYGLENRLELERQKSEKAQQALQLAMQIIHESNLLDE